MQGFLVLALVLCRQLVLAQQPTKEPSDPGSARDRLKCGEKEFQETRSNYEKCASNKIASVTAWLQKVADGGQDEKEVVISEVCSHVQDLLHSCGDELGWCFTAAEVEETKRVQRSGIKEILHRHLPQQKVESCLQPPKSQDEKTEADEGELTSQPTVSEQVVRSAEPRSLFETDKEDSLSESSDKKDRLSESSDKEDRLSESSDEEEQTTKLVNDTAKQNPASNIKSTPAFETRQSETSVKDTNKSATSQISSSTFSATDSRSTTASNLNQASSEDEANTSKTLSIDTLTSKSVSEQTVPSKNTSDDIMPSKNRTDTTVTFKTTSTSLRPEVTSTSEKKEKYPTECSQQPCQNQGHVALTNVILMSASILSIFLI